MKITQEQRDRWIARIGHIPGYAPVLVELIDALVEDEPTDQCDENDCVGCQGCVEDEPEDGVTCPACKTYFGWDMAKKDGGRPEPQPAPIKCDHIWISINGGVAMCNNCGAREDD